ncbi:MAG: phosphoglycerol transferase MdoB-like AlkP superfamily enzyme, partial [Granulosicoccus sp.]
MRSAFADFFLVLKKLGLVLVIYTICRIAFYYFNATYFDTDGLLRAFMGGVRFDISAIIYINLVFIILSLAPIPIRRNDIYRKVMNYIFLGLNVVGILFNCIDIEYFKFTLKRSTFDLFTQIGTGDDMKNLVPQFIKDYWYLIVLFLMLTWLLYFFSKKIIPHKNDSSWNLKNYLIQTAVLLATLALIVLGGRGGFQYRPLSLINATQYGNADKMPLVLNTPFTLIRSYKADYLIESNYFTNAPECSAIFDPVKHYNSNEVSKDNVVILLLESFSYEFLNSIGEHGQYLTPFLDSLSDSSLYFERSYANGKKSVEGVPSVCSSIPSLMTNPFIFSPYSANKVNSLAQVLRKEGYYNSFFHGGVNGTMGFDSYALASGFNDYIGLNEYPYDGHEDGTWGVYDEEFFDYFNQKLLEQKEPFFSLCFSLTSHHPYKIPERYMDDFPRAKNPYEHVIQYSDYALKTFFENARKQEWFDRTLFILTADHTAQSFHPYFRNREGL